MAETQKTDYVLGVDLGSNSLGWALIERINGKPVGLLRSGGFPSMGARIFDSATEGDRESGSEESRNLKRRNARLARRQIWRRARRIRNIFRLLQSYGLLPAGNGNDPIARQGLLNDLDRRIAASEWFKGKSPAYDRDRKVCVECERLANLPQKGPSKRKRKCCPECDRLRQVMPYLLRAAAIEEPLEPHFLGRAFYHLAQRRGFLSNRKATPKKGEKAGEVNKGISKLHDAMRAADAPTLGAYFSGLSPAESRIRGPQHWTSRKMYELEFNLIWSAQASHHPGVLTPDRLIELRQAIFHQRQIWFDQNSIGRCELEPDERRAPMYLLTSQRFRLLDKINNLRVLPPGELARALTPGDRQKLIDKLEFKRDLSFDRIRKILDLTKEYKFNIEPLKQMKRKAEEATTDATEENEKSGAAKVKGNQTNAAFYQVFQEKWKDLPPEEQDSRVEYAYSFEDSDKLKDAAKRKWNLDDPAAEALSKISFETRPIAFSLKAMVKLLPLLKAGKTVEEARREVYPEKFACSAPLAMLPPVQFAADTNLLRKALKDTAALPAGAKLPDPIGEIRNPAVTRSLTELRKVVNAIIARHGKPAEIHVELLRELRNPKGVRERIAEANDENRAAREKTKTELRKEFGGHFEPTNDDARKYLLYKELPDRRCVYCGEYISPRDQNFFGSDADIHIDHIIPRSLLPENKFANLILCHAHCNAEKGDRTPYQAFTGARHDEIIHRVKQLQGRGARQKLRRFLMKDDELKAFLDKFTERQFQDSAYASKIAAKYLGYLYGGVIDGNRTQRIVCTSGEVTAELRNSWGLHGVLDDGPTSNGGTKEKSRVDHRHHAVDAVAVALTNQKTVKERNEAAKLLSLGSRRGNPPIPLPWNDFAPSIREEADRIVVSHRVSKKVSGPLHEETIYSPPFPDGKVHVRKSLAKLKKPEIKKITDPSVQKLVEEKLAALGGDPKKFADEKNLPRFPLSNVPIKSARLESTEKTIPLGKESLVRHVKTGSNHHVEIHAVTDGSGRDEKWDGKVVTMFEAHCRLVKRIPVVQKDQGPQVKFRLSLSRGEAVECDDRKGQRELFVVQKISKFSTGRIEIALAEPRDAKNDKDLVRLGPNGLLKLNAKKVAVSPLGEVSEAHD